MYDAAGEFRSVVTTPPTDVHHHQRGPERTPTATATTSTTPLQQRPISILRGKPPWSVIKPRKFAALFSNIV
ncbi:hypothetical protein Trydic_g22279 [Trypoxylus dichotomus]